MWQFINILKVFARWILRTELHTLNSVVKNQEKVIAEYSEQLDLRLYELHNPKPEVRTVVSQERFNDAVNKLPAMIVNGTSTELQVAALVGQQATVEALRKALVSG